MERSLPAGHGTQQSHTKAVSQHNGLGDQAQRVGLKCAEHLSQVHHSVPYRKETKMKRNPNNKQENGVIRGKEADLGITNIHIMFIYRILCILTTHQGFLRVLWFYPGTCPTLLPLAY